MRAPRCIACLNWAVLFSVLSFSAAADSPRPEPLDTSYIAGDTAIVVVAHPQQALARKATLPSFTAQMLEAFKTETGIDAKNLRQVVLQFGTDTKEEDGRNDLGNDALTAVFRFDKPIDTDAIAARAFGPNTKTAYKGQTYYQPQSKYQPAVWFPDNRAMIVANEWRVLKIIDEPHSMGMMVSRLRQADSSADLLIEVDAVQGQPLLQEAFSGAPDEPFAPLKMAAKVNRATLTGRLATETPLEIQLHAKNADAAKELRIQAEALLKLAKESWPKNRDQIRESARDSDRELINEFIKTVDTTLAGTSFAISDNRLTLKVKRNGGSFEPLTVFIGMMVGRASAASAEALKAEAERERRAALKEGKLVKEPEREKNNSKETANGQKAE